MGLGTNCLLMLTPARAGLAYLGPTKPQTGCSPSLVRLSVGCWGHKSLDSLWCCEAQSQRLRRLKEKAGEGGTEEGRGIKSDSLLFTEKEENNVSSWVRVTSAPLSKRKIYINGAATLPKLTTASTSFWVHKRSVRFESSFAKLRINRSKKIVTPGSSPHNSSCNFHTPNKALVGENRMQGINAFMAIHKADFRAWISPHTALMKLAQA